MIVERSRRAALVVIDPVCGFTAADGTYGLLHGASEKVPIRQAVENFAAFVADLAPGCTRRVDPTSLPAGTDRH